MGGFGGPVLIGLVFIVPVNVGPALEKEEVLDGPLGGGVKPGAGCNSTDGSESVETDAMATGVAAEAAA